MAALKIRSFLPAKTTGDIRTDPAAAMTTSINRLGFVVEDIGHIIAKMHMDKLQWLDDQKDARKLAKDQERESKIEKDVEKEVEVEDKKAGGVQKKTGGFLQRLLAPFMWIGTKLLTFFALNWMADPKNGKFIKTVLPWIGKWLGTFWKVLSTGVNWILEAFGEKSPVMGALKIFGGIAALFAADRILRPWKLIGDVNKLRKLVSNDANKNQQTNQSQQMTKRQIAKQRLKNINQIKAKNKRIAKLRRMKRMGKVKMGRFVKGGGLSALAGVASFAGRLSAGDSVQKAAGGGIGAAVGGVAMTALLTPILGPFAPLVGNLLGGFIGDKIGAFIGDAITPIIAPIKDYFVNIWWPAMKAFFTPLATTIGEYMEVAIPVVKMVWTKIQPFLSEGLKNVGKFLTEGPVGKAIQALLWLVKTGAWILGGLVNGIAKVIGGSLNTYNRVFGDEETKADAQLENENYDVKNLNEQLATLKKNKEKKGGGKRSVWFGVDGVVRTSNGAPGMHIGNGHGHPFGSTIDEKIKHWEEVLIPHAKKKAAEAAQAVKDLENSGGNVEALTTFTDKELTRGDHVVTSPALVERWGKIHKGVDIATDIGEKLYTFMDAVVDQVGTEGATKGYGNYIAFTTKDGIGQFYAHMNKMSTLKDGQKIKKGTQVGEAGNSGASTGPHLHWETATNPADVGYGGPSIFDPLTKYGKESPFSGKLEPVSDYIVGGTGGAENLNKELVQRSEAESSAEFRGGTTETMYIVQPVLRDIVQLNSGDKLVAVSRYGDDI